MQAKEYLMQIQLFAERIREKELELKAAEYSGVQAIDYAKDRVQTSPDGTPPEIKRIERIIDEISEELAKYTELRHNIIEQIHGLDDKRQEQVLYERFVNCKKLVKIANEIPCAESTVYRWYNDGLEAFQKKYLEALDARI